MRYLQYLALAAVIECVPLAAITAVLSVDYAVTMAIVLLPSALWTARLVVGWRRGRITRRMPMLDGGPTRAGHFWSFTPEIYVREPGFDYFKGYFVKECLACTLLWTLLLLAPVTEVLNRTGPDPG